MNYNDFETWYRENFPVNFDPVELERERVRLATWAEEALARAEQYRAQGFIPIPTT